MPVYSWCLLPEVRTSFLSGCQAAGWIQEETPDISLVSQAAYHCSCFFSFCLHFLDYWLLFKMLRVCVLCVFVRGVYTCPHRIPSFTPLTMLPLLFGVLSLSDFTLANLVVKEMKTQIVLKNS